MLNKVLTKIGNTTTLRKGNPNNILPYIAAPAQPLWYVSLDPRFHQNRGTLFWPIPSCNLYQFPCQHSTVLIASSKCQKRKEECFIQIKKNRWNKSFDRLLQQYPYLIFFSSNGSMVDGECGIMWLRPLPLLQHWRGLATSPDLQLLRLRPPNLAP